MSGLLARISLYAAGMATGGAFAALFVASSGRASYTMLGGALAGLFVGSAGRRLRFLLLPPVSVLYALLAVYGRVPLSLEGWQKLFSEAGEDVYEATETMYFEPAPYESAPGIFVLLVPVVIVVVAFATSITLHEGKPVLSIAVLGVTLGTLATANFEDGMGPYFAVFLASGVALLLFSGAQEPIGWLAPITAIIVVGIVLAVPGFARAAIPPPLVDWTRLFAGAGGASRLAVQADVGEYLTAGRDAKLLRVQSPEPLYWRGGTLDHFDGARWSSTVKPGEDDGEEVAAGVPTRTVVQSAQVLDARTQLVFGGYEILRTSLPAEDVRRLPDGSWAAERPFEEGDGYRVLSVVPQPTTEQLQNAGAGYPAYVREKYLQLPGDDPRVVAETAQEIRRRYEPTTPYETARAIERYLRYDGGFTYDLSVDYRRADWAIEEFLGDGRVGFCTQFATSMTLIARELGVPARVVYGATSGKQVGTDEYLVSGWNLHTWVEVYFPGVGWYPFEPSPGFSVTSAMEANAPLPQSAAGSPLGRDALMPENRILRDGPLPGAAPGPLPNGDPANDRAPESPRLLPTSAKYLLALAGLLLAVPLLKWMLAARGTPEVLYRDALWRLEDALWPKLRVRETNPATLTPTERLVTASRVAGLDPGPFEDLAEIYSEYLYSSEPPEDARDPHRRAVRECRELPLWRRVLGAFNPASVLGVGARNLVARTIRGGQRARRALPGGRS